MPPLSRGTICVRVIRRYVSTVPSPKTSKQPAPSRFPTQTRSPHPSRPPPNKSQSQNLKADAPKPESGDPSRTQNSRLRNLLQSPRYRSWRRFLIAIPAITLAGMHCPYTVLPVSGQSMAPFFNADSPDGLPTRSWIVIQHWRNSSSEKDYKTKGEPKPDADQGSDFRRGQIVVFDTPHDAAKLAVKRVVALPGDMVQPLPDYPGGDAPVVVPWNHLWVEGDAGTRKLTQDSNSYGPISQNLVVGEAIALWSSWFGVDWIDWTKDRWPAQEEGRVEEKAVMEAAVDPDYVNYSSGWRNGSIALILDQMRRQPDQVLYSFVKDAQIRQETRRLYNNALYVAEVATSEPERALARDVRDEMEDIYGREALVFGIRVKRQARDRGELPNIGNSRMGENIIKDHTASDAEKWLQKQGWEIERNTDGSVKTQMSSAS